MRDINDIDLRLVDTTILMVFLGVMQHRQATAVARDMGLTQPAVSHALKRLRTLYGDPLFLRRSHGLEPTALAHDLEPRIRRIVHLISETFTGPDDSDPAKTHFNFRIGAFDYELTSILPGLIAGLRETNPNIGLQAFPLTSFEALDGLVRGQINLAIGYFDFPANAASTFIAEQLFTEHYVLAARRGHPILAKGSTVEQFAAADHLLISGNGLKRNIVDHALQLQGLRRTVRITVPSLFSALSIVEKSDLIVTLPSRTAKENGHRFDIAYKPLPIDGGSFHLHAVRHKRDEESKLHSWLIEQIRKVIT